MSQKSRLGWTVPGRLAYVVSHSYPYSSNGYAVRTHGVASGLVHHGCNVVVINRPGRPWDLPGFSQSVDFRAHIELDGVRYLFLPSPSRHGVTFDGWREAAAKTLETSLRVFKPSVVMAASNWENALPALDAAERLGLPFWYEVRGFWELSRLSRQPEWEGTDEFSNHIAQETEMALRASRVFTLNRQMCSELVRRGVPAGKITIVPNAVTGVPSLPQTDDKARAALKIKTRYVVGYVGSFTAYEGLDDLLRACALVRGQGVDLTLLMVGSSKPTASSASGTACPITDALNQLARELDFEHYLVMPGRVSPDELPQLYAAIDLVVIPRKALAVTEVVSPIKPLEAAAFGKALLVSDVAPLMEFAREFGAITFSKTNSEDLINRLSELLREPERLRELGMRARAWAISQRTFVRAVEPMAAALRFASDDTPLARARYGSEVKLADLPIALDSSDGVAQKNSGALVANAPKIEPVSMSQPGKGFTAGEDSAFLERVEALASEGDEGAVLQLIQRQTEGLPERVSAVIHLKAAHTALSSGLEDLALDLCEAGLMRDSSLTVIRSAARLHLDAARLPRAATLADQIHSLSSKVTESDMRLLGEIKARNDLFVWALQPAQPRQQPVIKGRVLNALAFSLPYTSVGYATRSHGLAMGLRRAGWDVRPYTIPGFPFDLKPELQGQDIPLYDEIDGVRYGRIFDFARRGISETSYLLQAIEHWERIIELEQPEIVHAASNYVTALPALIAARRKGVHFIYEVRGFWEVTRSSRDRSFVTTSKYRFMKLFEAIVAQQADEVITITQGMQEELVRLGLPKKKISIAYNSVDAERFLPRPRDPVLAAKLGIPEDMPVIGYIGSIVDYEGLDDLVRACSDLVLENCQFRLLVVGDGNELENLRHQVSRLGIQDRVIMPGRVSHDEVEAYYSLIDIAPFPRKPWEVCELVSPLKPFEAMALQKLVIASDTRALKEIVVNQRTGMLFRKGDIGHLTEAIKIALRDSELRRRVGVAARRWIIDERTWNSAASVCSQTYVRALVSTLTPSEHTCP
jgi:glycosyltransferase involved in cell wall biosynthesis